MPFWACGPLLCFGGALMVRKAVAALFIQTTVRRWRAACELRRRQMARRRFLGAMQARAAGFGAIAFTRFRRSGRRIHLYSRRDTRLLRAVVCAAAAGGARRV